MNRRAPGLSVSARETRAEGGPRAAVQGRTSPPGALEGEGGRREVGARLAGHSETAVACLYLGLTGGRHPTGMRVARRRWSDPKVRSWPEAGRDVGAAGEQMVGARRSCRHPGCAARGTVPALSGSGISCRIVALS